MQMVAEPAGFESPDQYAEDVYRRLRGAWLKVLHRRAPHVAQSIQDGVTHWDEGDYADHLQASTIWFHLQQIMDENLTIRTGRLAEQDGDPGEGGGQALAGAAGDLPGGTDQAQPVGAGGEPKAGHSPLTHMDLRSGGF